MSAPSYHHLGKKVERIRKIKGIKQEALAEQLGMTRQSLSKLEQSEAIEDKKLELFAQALGRTAEDIRHFNEEAVMTGIRYSVKLHGLLPFLDFLLFDFIWRLNSS